MTDKIELIKAEIESLKDISTQCGHIGKISRVIVLNKLMDFINSLPEEPVSEDLEKAAEEYAYMNWQSDDYHEGAAEGLPFDAIGHTEKSFKAGANAVLAEVEKALDLGEPPYLISVEQAYYRVQNIIKQLKAL